VAASGALSAFFVTLANAWMNQPAGFDPAQGPGSAQPLLAMFPPGWSHEVIHVLLSCYAATGLAVAGIHAFFLRRQPGHPFHRAAFGIALWVGGAASLLQPLSGDHSARQVAVFQPLKLAALEGHFRTMRRAPLHLGGIPDAAAGETRWSLEIPAGLSLLAFHDPDAEVKGLEEFPRGDWPDPLKVHLAFQAMVGLGAAMAALSLAALLLRWRTRALPVHPAFLGAAAACTPFGFLALEAGWLVTEWGRQPFAIRGVMRTGEAVTPLAHLSAPFWAFAALYLFLAAAVAWLLWRQILRSPPAAGGPGEAP
jgi:cytochrome d ubiquinol oxidase subunit I